MKHSRTQELFEYWNALRGTRAAPDRIELEPAAMVHLLRDVFLLERRPSGATTVRLAGTRICELFGRELKGNGFLDLWRPENRPDLCEILHAVAHEAAAAVVGATARAQDRDAWPVEILMLPLGSRTRDHVLGLAASDSLPAWFLVHPVLELELVTMRLSWPSDGHDGGRALPVHGERPVLAHPGARRIGRFLVYEGGQL